MISCSTLGVGIFAPGLADWPAARAVFSATGAYVRTDNVAPASSLLPAAERRRATRSTRVALTAAQQALAHAGVDAREIAAVFGSSSGSPDIIHDICAMLAAGDHQISPTKFHNSVHNAASGYYSIAVASHRAVTSLCALDGTAAVALLEAAVQANTEESPVLMVCYDLPYPYPLSEARPTIGAWAVALVLAPADSPAAIAHLTLTAVEDEASGCSGTPMEDHALEAARLGNPTARLLPLLAALTHTPSSEFLHAILLRQGNGSLLRVQVSVA